MYEKMEGIIIAVTNRHLCRGDFLETVRRLADSDVDSIILREKDLSEEEYTRLAETVLNICEGKKRCILHTYIDVAKRLNCPYIHLPLPELLQMAEAEPEQRFPFLKIGVSVHSKEESIRAWKAGADYLIAGHVFTTDCKKGVPPRGLGYIQEVSRAVEIPVYGIGGITRRNMAEVVRAGAKGVCIMSGMMNESCIF